MHSVNPDKMLIGKSTIWLVGPIIIIPIFHFTPNHHEFYDCE